MLVLCIGERRLKLAIVSSRSCLLPCSERQELGEFVDLRVKAIEHGILAGDFLAQEKLCQNEHRQQKHDRQQQGRQRVDETRPVIDVAYGFAVADREPC